LGSWECSCEHQRIRLNPRYKAGEINKEKAACKHMREAFYYFAFHWIDTLIELEKEQERRMKENPFRIGAQRCE
jgi:hypothetical protein